MFKTALSNILKPEDRELFVTLSGDKDRQNYKAMWTDRGTYELVPDGVIHCYEEIQSWKATCDMSTVMERYLRTGDSSILNQRAGFFADVTTLPTNYAELANTLQNADAVFNAMPKEIKAQFEYNPAKFFANIDDVGGVLNAYYGKKSEVNQVPVPEEGTGSSAAVPVAPDMETNAGITLPEGGII